jgi:hypothetical protein
MKTTLEQFVQMTAFVHANNKDFEKMYAHFNVAEDDWREIAAHWMKQVGSDAALGAQFQNLMLAELERLKSAPASASTSR